MNFINSEKKESCRLCRNKNLSRIFKISPSQPVDGFRPHAHKYLNLPRFNMDLYICKSCGHHQLLDVVNPDILYGSYIYTSSSSPDLHEHFLNYSKYLFNKGCIKKDKVVLDVGCNDGLFLNFLQNYSENLFGIDPAPNIVTSNNNSNYKLFSGYCNKSNLLKFKTKYSLDNFDLITANNVFAHADNLEEMLESISDSLSNEGYFCFEVSYIYDLVYSNIVDYIYHEHLSYHGIKSLKPFLKNHSLYIVDILRIPTKGGSIRVLASKKKSLENINLINEFIKLENSVNCYSENSFNVLQKKISLYKENLISFLNKNQVKEVFSYGAAPSSIVNSLLLGYEDYIICFLDDNTLRHNLLAPNTFAPVLSPSILKNHEKPIIIIGAWRFKDLIIDKILNINKNSRIIIPSLKDGLEFINFD
tara:strand:+ start:159 stop:1412 length:1254 start_codon:yes stop_codon:yes gene_type:complete